MSPARAPSRFAAIDVLRGIVMVLMSIDHASETFNRGRLFTDSIWFYKPGTPLPVLQFMTRWIAHLCAPTFVALAGVALAISTESRRAKGESERSIDVHIGVRGLLIIAFEVAWMSWAMREWGQFLFQVLYAIGASLVCMVLLRRLKPSVLLALGLLLALGSELLVGILLMKGMLDRLPVALLLAGGFLFDGRLIVAYPVLPWLAMMCLGWAFGQKLVAWRAAGADVPREASRTLAIAGTIGLVVFAVLRGVNGFGNMQLFRDDASIVQWLHVSKYPPSATYTGLELGIAALLLAVLVRFDARTPKLLEPVRLLGQTALFYYLLHIHVLKLAAWATHRHGELGIKSAYLGALGVLIALFPACAWYRRYKAAHPNGWARWI